MPKRGARLVPFPKPDASWHNDGVTIDPCLLCGDPLGPWPAQWCELIGEAEPTAGFAHARCAHEYQLFAAQLPFAATLFTPEF